MQSFRDVTNTEKCLYEPRLIRLRKSDKVRDIVVEGFMSKKLTIKLGPVYSRFASELDEDLLEDVRQLLSYNPPGYYFSPKYKKKINGKRLWDGRIYLLYKASYFPTGLIKRVTKFLEEEGIPCRIKDERLFPKGQSLPLPEDFSPWQHQSEGLDIALEEKNGIFSVATSGGKTDLAIMITAKLGLPTVFVTHLKGLLHQTQRRFATALGVPVGIVGDGIKDIQDITVVSVKTLARMKKKPAFLNRFKVMLNDEEHNFTADTFVKVCRWINAPYRFGLSGTVSLEGKGMILEGYTGPIIQTIDLKYLEENDIVTKFDVKIIEVPNLKLDSYDYKTAYKKGIVRNKERNKIIGELTEFYALTKKEPVLILFRYIDHGKRISKILKGLGIDHHLLYQKSTTAERDKAKDDIESGKCRVIVASSIFDQGENLPSVSILILATGLTGGEEGRLLLQRIGRVLRKAEGKSRSVVVDFYDDTCKYLRDHSELRIETYRENDMKYTFYEW